jgi:hypothetical protein
MDFNVTGLILQLFYVSRIFKAVGPGCSLFVGPCIAAGRLFSDIGGAAVAAGQNFEDSGQQQRLLDPEHHRTGSLLPTAVRRNTK